MAVTVLIAPPPVGVAVPTATGVELGDELSMQALLPEPPTVSRSLDPPCP